MEFDGDDNITISSAPTISDKISIYAWVYIPSDNNAFNILVSRSTTSVKMQYELRFKLVTDGGGGDNIDFVWRNSADTGYSYFHSPDNSMDSNIGNWINVIATHDWGGTGSTAIYIDGVSQSLTLSSATDETITSGTFETIIGERNGGTTEDFNGTISELAIWNDILTTNEIDNLVNSKVKRLPLQLQSDNLVHYYLLDDCSSGSSGDGVTFINASSPGTYDGTGDDGAGSGLTCKAEEVLSYP